MFDTDRLDSALSKLDKVMMGSSSSTKRRRLHHAISSRYESIITEPDAHSLPQLEQLLPRMSSKYKTMFGIEAVPRSKRASEYNPTSLSAFLKRLRTFAITLYPPKSMALSPPEMAARGWSCVGPNRLACGLCEAQFALPSFTTLTTRAMASLETKCIALVPTSHKHGCAWRRKGVDLARVFRVPLDLDALAHRWRSCADLMTNNAGQIHISDLSDIPKELILKQAERLDAPMEEPPFLLALTGWTKSSLHDNCLECHLCQRQVLLTEQLSALKLHRIWCPYISGENQAGWQNLLQTLNKSQKRKVSAAY